MKACLEGRSSLALEWQADEEQALRSIMLTDLRRALGRRLRALLGTDGIDRKLVSLTCEVKELRRQVDSLRVMASIALAERSRNLPDFSPLIAAEFQVFSQFGEDGILQYLLSKVEVPDTRFVEFGVQDYTESNTRYLLTKDNWSGLILDGSPVNISKVRQSELYWRHSLTAVPAFITRDNINQLLYENDSAGRLGILSIDIDGNDYWVWEAISVCDPAIVVVEYNAVFGSDAAVTIPYQADFVRTRAHFSNLYWGCSLKALVELGLSKGYSFVGCNSHGNNAFFVKKDLSSRLAVYDTGGGYAPSRFRESLSSTGDLTHLTGDARLAQIQQEMVVDLTSGNLRRIGDFIRSN